MSTDRINRGILLTMVVIGAIAYALLYSHASTVFRVLVPLGLPSWWARSSATWSTTGSADSKEWIVTEGLFGLLTVIALGLALALAAIAFVFVRRMERRTTSPDKRGNRQRQIGGE